ncbi:troponin C, isoallergen Bla g 6.0301-like [Telopea speciosissima]|uniref:troponin C, isoallergen Bla g 6.0301-like n=1 Tax=Telopea speciosissima TaxID=54955 RepID=UPI001CC7E342|nr:troponin C, isoallergen Bla g 6.0301-like [Telopea speciosissima]
MSVIVISGPTLTEFVQDKEAFDKCVNEQFMNLDTDGDGVLSRSELSKGFNCLLSLGNDLGTEEEIKGLYDIIFDKFDADRSGTVDRDEFQSEMKEILLAMARGIGDIPLQVALENDSFLMRAAQHELAKKR